MQTLAKELTALQPDVLFSRSTPVTGALMKQTRTIPIVLLKEIIPSINRVAFIFDPKVAPGGGSYYTKLVESAAPSFAVVPTAVPVYDAVGIKGAIGDFANKPGGGLLVLPDATTNLHRELIISLAARYRVPAVYGFRHIAAEGGLISYGIDIVEPVRRAATYVDPIYRCSSQRNSS
jgi:ABC-type uncharacterized transport system substrate-binding protein